jgi:hypothetical protein
MVLKDSRPTCKEKSAHGKIGSLYRFTPIRYTALPDGARYTGERLSLEEASVKEVSI